MQMSSLTSRSFAGLSLLVVVGLTRNSMAQSGEPSPSPTEPAPSSTVPPPTAVFPAEPEPTPVTAPNQPPQTKTAVFPAEPEPTPVTAPNQPPQTKTPVSQDRPFGSASTGTPSSERTISAPPKPTSQDESSDDIIRFGPIVGVGLPNLISLGGMFKLTRFLGGGINVGLIPTTKISFYGDATLSYQEYDVYGRLFPFGGGFFLGAGVGYATIKGTMKDTFDTSSYQSALPVGLSIPNPLTYESEGSVKTMIVTPQIGYFYTTDVGFSIGLDLGAQVPIAPSKITYNSRLSLPSGTPATVESAIQSKYVAPNDKKVKDTLDTIGRTPLPTINLRVGWLF